MSSGADSSFRADAPSPGSAAEAGRRRQPRARAVSALAGWTIFIWVTRVRNILGDNELSGWSMVWRLGVSIALIVVAVVLGGQVLQVVRRRDDGAFRRPSKAGLLASGLSLFGIVWWVLRGGAILLADHAIAFKVVHTVLGLVTIALSALVLWVTSPAEGR